MSRDFPIITLLGLIQHHGDDCLVLLYLGVQLLSYQSEPI
jgi:hypothetical protein